MTVIPRRLNTLAWANIAVLLGGALWCWLMGDPTSIALWLLAMGVIDLDLWDVGFLTPRIMIYPPVEDDLWLSLI